MVKQRYTLLIVLACFMAFVGVGTADEIDPYEEYNDSYGELYSDPSAIDGTLYFSTDPGVELVLSPYIEQAGETVQSSPQIVLMPIVVPISISANISFTFVTGESGEVIDMYSMQPYVTDLSDEDIEAFLTFLVDDLSGSEEIAMDEFNEFLLNWLTIDEIYSMYPEDSEFEIEGTYFTPDQIDMTVDGTDVGTLNDMYVELYNTYYGESAEELTIKKDR